MDDAQDEYDKIKIELLTKYNNMEKGRDINTIKSEYNVKKKKLFDEFDDILRACCTLLIISLFFNAFVFISL